MTFSYFSPYSSNYEVTKFIEDSYFIRCWLTKWCFATALACYAEKAVDSYYRNTNSTLNMFLMVLNHIQE